jgi:hypothetical protein
VDTRILPEEKEGRCCRDGYNPALSLTDNPTREFAIFQSELGVCGLQAFRIRMRKKVVVAAISSSEQLTGAEGFTFPRGWPIDRTSRQRQKDSTYLVREYCLT